MEEERIEASIEKQARTPLKEQELMVKINTTFFDCASCCDGQIIGCYAPNGDHCEKVLEIGKYH